GPPVPAAFPQLGLAPDHASSFRAGPAENAALEMVVLGLRFDARGVLGNLFSGGDKEQAASTGPEEEGAAAPLLDDVDIVDPLRRSSFRADIGKAIGNHGTSFTGVRVSMVEIDNALWSLDVAATAADGKLL